jgi:hypothetical protein
MKSMCIGKRPTINEAKEAPIMKVALLSLLRTIAKRVLSAACILSLEELQILQ